jgi:signal transduction histidine kinase
MILGDRLLECGQSLDEKRKDTIARMIRLVGRMSGLIEDMFLYSSVALSSYSETTIHLKPVMENVLRDLETLIQETGGRVEFYGGAFLDPLTLIKGPRSLIHQLLLNLISNALKFNREGEPPLVRVRVGISDSHPDWCEIEVEDNGIGFDEKHVDRIFKPFQRLHGTGQYPGIGMGLTICKKIVNRHGGTIVAHSRPGRGSRFVVRLPVQLAPSTEVFAT